MHMALVEARSPAADASIISDHPQHAMGYRHPYDNGGGGGGGYYDAANPAAAFAPPARVAFGAAPLDVVFDYQLQDEAVHRTVAGAATTTFGTPSPASEQIAAGYGHAASSRSAAAAAAAAEGTTLTMRTDRIAFRMRSDEDVLDDGYKWRKYGKKAVKNSPNPRNYYRCSTEGCDVKKRVERDRDDPRYVVTMYEGVHNHVSPGTVYYATQDAASGRFVVVSGMQHHRGP